MSTVPLEGPHPARRYLSVAAFRTLGYLQEVNRQVLHPLGLALEVVRDPDGTERLSGIWDSRDDPEGIVYAAPAPLPELAAHVSAQQAMRRPAREAALGYWVQPPGSGVAGSDSRASAERPK